MNKKHFALVLALLMLTQTAACSNGSSGANESNKDGENQISDSQTENGGDGDASSVETDAEEASLERVRKEFDGKDYGGIDFKIISEGPGDWRTFDLYSEGYDGEVINDAVYDRNLTLSQLLNVNIVDVPSNKIPADVKRMIGAQTPDYDAILDGINPLATMAQTKYLIDIRTIDSIHGDESWWDNRMYEQCTIARATYFLTGDITVMDDNGTWCYLFNKDIVNDLGLENPYTLVDEGRWTIDKHDEMAAAAVSDLNGDGKWTGEDRYGFVTEPYNTIAIWNCFGYRIAEKDENDMPYLAYDGEEQLNALTRVLETQYSDFTNLGLKTTVGASAADTRERQFSSGGALFYFAGFRNVPLFRDSDTDFGIIPAPKYNEEQKEYNSSFSPGHTCAYGVPVTSVDPEMTGDILECMARVGQIILTPAYYEKTLMGKSVRDQESKPMVELIFATRNYDIGNIYNIGKMADTMFNMNDPGKVASSLARTKKIADKALRRFYEAFESGEN